ncbi:WD repeat-containing protein 8 [Athelia psychrophila]|uniref:WD repeat-containing protein 8 n=1 Tax=Athelia psychrophila TaxID=1759441 RepID=A0A165ZEX0_9AGAM|nr:WD repeat-containing protein 8 [Fibularhizoctonia sp. CBS 109695]
MDFTEIYKQSAGLVHFSPGANFIATAVLDRLIVRRADSFQITRTWLLDPPKPRDPIHPISHIGWSCDSEYLLAACAKRGVVRVFKLREEHWAARIDAGTEGLVRAEWAPDGRHILCFSEWGLRVTVWSLVTGGATYIQFPIHPERGYAFRADGRYFILAERHKSKDTLGVYDTADGYKLARHFPLPTASLAHLALSPTGNHLAVWEGPLEYKLTILTLAGALLATFTPAPDPGFGVRAVAWHPSGALLAVGGWDDTIHILDSLTWGPVHTLALGAGRIPAGVAIWREPPGWLDSDAARGFISYEKLRGAQTLKPDTHTSTHTSTKADTKGARDKDKDGGKARAGGAVQLEWNKNGTLLLVRFEATPAAVHVFAFPSPAAPAPATPRLRSVLLHTRAVLAARWNPVRAGSLAVCCAARSVYTWSDEWVGEGAGAALGLGLGEEEEGEGEEVAECIGVPARKFETRDLRWAPDGKGMVLIDKDTFCCAFEVQEEPEVAAAQEA